MEISLFLSNKDTDARRKTVTWEDLVGFLSNPRPRPEGPDVKAALRTWSPATFVGDARKAANVEQVSALVFDVDEDPVPSLGGMREALCGLVWFAHSSSSATLISPRWRLVVPLSRPMSADEHGRAWRALSGRLRFQVGAASKDPSRVWFEACVCEDGSFVMSQQ